MPLRLLPVERGATPGLDRILCVWEPEQPLDRAPGEWIDRIHYTDRRQLRPHEFALGLTVIEEHEAVDAELQLLGGRSDGLDLEIPANLPQDEVVGAQTHLVPADVL